MAEQSTVDAVWQRLYEMRGSKSTRGEPRIDLWADYTDAEMVQFGKANSEWKSHANYDHYIQDCVDCQKAWIRAILESAESVDGVAKRDES